MKRRLLREAVHDNVNVIEGRPPVAQTRRHRTVPRAVLVACSLVILVLVLAGFRLAGEGSGLSGLAMTLIPSFESDPDAAPDRVIQHAAPTADTRAMFPLPIRRVAIDAGHGGRDPGTLHGSGIYEKEIALDVALRLRDLLVADGLEVVMTRESDTYLELAERVDLANEAHADIFLSIHVNWLDSPTERGVETYYLGPTEDPYLAQLTQRENTGSGYSLTDFRRLLQGVYEHVRESESRDFALKVQRAMHRSLRQVNPELQNRGVKTAPFVVLVRTDMPAILTEVSCLSNEQEAKLLKKPRYRQYIAEALARGVRNYADSHQDPETHQLASGTVQKGS